MDDDEQLKVGRAHAASCWRLLLEPRAWQKLAYQRWKECNSGIVEVVTGGGKTVFAQVCLLEFFRENPGAQALVIVPTISLLDQWWVALQDEMNVAAEDIGLLSGQERPSGEEPIILAVINSARKFTSKFSQGRKLFLVVDECHRAGSPVMTCCER